MSLNIKLYIKFKLINNLFRNYKQAFFFFPIFFLTIFIINICFAENGVIKSKSNSKISITSTKNKYVKWAEAGYKRIYVMENMAPLPFKKFPYKPVYKGDISDETVEESQKIKDSAINQIVSTFNLYEQKKKDRQKNKKKMLVFNKEKNKKFFEYFKSIKRVRIQPANFSGFHYDYTKYIQNFRMITKR